jgi:predicted dehydrogenase
LFLATWLFGEPSLIKTVSKRSVTGIDEYTGMMLQYPNGEIAQLMSAISFNTAIEAEIIGTKGRIKITIPGLRPLSFPFFLMMAQHNIFPFHIKAMVLNMK